MTAFRRYCRVTLGTKPMATQIEGGSLISASGQPVQQGLRIIFEVRKTVKIEFNSKKIQIYNLSEALRKRIAGNLPITLEAGYVDNFGQIFKGHARVIDHYRDGPDWITSIQAGDGWRAGSTLAYSSWAPGTSLEDIAAFLGEKSGLGLGNLKEMLRTASRETLQQFAHGHVSQGSALRQLDKLIRSCNLTWSIQDEQIQVVRKNEPVGSLAPLVSAETGLINSPRHIAWKPNWPTYMSFRSLLNANLRCGYSALLQSKTINGKFRLMKIIHNGDTMGTGWYSDCEGV